MHKFLEAELVLSDVKSRCDFLHVSQRSLFLISQTCWGFTPVLPNVFLHSISFPFTSWSLICKRATDRLTGFFFCFVFWITTDLLPCVFPTAVDECEQGRSFDSRDLRRQTYAATTTIFFSPRQGGRSKARGEMTSRLPSHLLRRAEGSIFLQAWLDCAGHCHLSKHKFL